MRTERRNVFETNSSSTHSLAIPKSQMNKEYPSHIQFNFGEFGWEFDEVNSADYLYTSIYSRYWGDNKKISEYLDKIAKVLDKHNISYDMQKPKSTGIWFEDGYVDHNYELTPFIDMLFASERKLLDFICFGLVFTGNDNSSSETYEGFLDRTSKYIEDTDYDKKRDRIVVIQKGKNPYYSKSYDEDYDWYEKGN